MMGCGPSHLVERLANRRSRDMLLRLHLVLLQELHTRAAYKSCIQELHTGTPLPAGQSALLGWLQHTTK
jgi:hypothetical protein